jgi:hypothetical protein
VDKRNDLLGESLVRRLLERPAGDQSAEPVRVVVGPELVVV